MLSIKLNKKTQFLLVFMLVLGTVSAFDISGTGTSNAINLVDQSTFNNNSGSVNSSDYWDDLDTPADISVSELNNNLCVERAGDTMTGPLTIQDFLTLTSGFNMTGFDIDTTGNTITEGNFKLKSDIRKIFFGSSNDSSIQFDGNDMIIASEDITPGDDLYFKNFLLYDFDDEVYISEDSAPLIFGASLDDQLYHDGVNFVINPLNNVHLMGGLNVTDDLNVFGSVDTGVVTTSTAPLQAKGNSGGSVLVMEENSGTEYMYFGIESQGDLFLNDDSLFHAFQFTEAGDLRIKGNLYLSTASKGVVLQMPVDGNTRYGLKVGSAGNLGDTDIISVSNRAVDGVVEIQPNTGAGGAGGETTIARFEDTNVSFYGNSYIEGNLNVNGCIVYNISGTPVTLGDCI